jgi:hypothetical protein
MPLGKEFLFGSAAGSAGTVPSVRMRLRSFSLPPIRDVAVVGRRAPIKSGALNQALRLLSPESFVEIGICDSLIESILVRQAILRKVSSEIVSKMVLQNIKPIMTDTEIIVVHLEIEVALAERA